MPVEEGGDLGPAPGVEGGTGGVLGPRGDDDGVDIAPQRVAEGDHHRAVIVDGDGHG